MAVRFSSIVDAQSGIRAIHIRTSRINLNYGWTLSSSGSGTKLTYTEVDPYAIVVKPNANFSGIVVSGIDTLYTDNVETHKLVADGATVVGTLEVGTLRADTFDVSNLDFSDTTLNVSSISVAGTAEINTLSAVHVLTEQGAMEQLTVGATLDANRAVLSELTVLQTLHAGTIKARKLAVDGELSANTITASFLDVDGWIDAKSLTVNGVPIMGGGASGGEGGSSGSMNLTIDSLSATQYIEVAGSSTYNNIRLSASNGLQLNIGASLTISNLYDADEDPYVTIDTTGIKAPTIHGTIVKGGTLSGGTVRGSTIHGASVQATTAELESLTADVVQVPTVRLRNWSLAGGDHTCSLTYDNASPPVTFITCDITRESQPVLYLPAPVSATELSTENFDVADMTLQHSLSIFGDSGASIFNLERIANEQASLSLTGNATIDGALSVESLTVNGVDITNNGSGSTEIPATIQVSVVEALDSNAAVAVPKLDSNSVTIDGTVDISATGKIDLNGSKFMADATGVSMLDATVTKLTVAYSEEDDTSGLWIGDSRLTGYEGDLTLDTLQVKDELNAQSAIISTAEIGTLTVQNLESSSSSGNIKIGALTVTSSGATVAGAFTANSIVVPNTGRLTAGSVQVNRTLTASSLRINNNATIVGTLYFDGAETVIDNNKISTPSLTADTIKADTIQELTTLKTKYLYVDGVQITGNGDGTASGSGFSGQYTGGDVVLGSISGPHFYGLAQKGTVTALGYNVYNPSTATLPDLTSTGAAGVRIDGSNILMAAGSSGNGIHMYTSSLRVISRNTGLSAIQFLNVGSYDSSLDISAANMTIFNADNTKMFSLQSYPEAPSITLNVGEGTKLSLHVNAGLRVDIKNSNLIYTDENHTGGWKFGNVSTATNFYTSYKSFIQTLDHSGSSPQEVLDAFAAPGRIHACLPLSLMLALFQLKSNLTLPPL